MSALATRIETETGRALTPGEIFEITRARETSLSRLLMLYITTGLVFMLLPGTLPGSLEPAGDQQPARGEFCLCRMDSGAWARADLRLDRHIHLRHRLLFHSQAAAYEFVRAADCVGVLVALDARR